MSAIAQGVIEGFGTSLAGTLPGALRLWAGGLTFYILIASVFAVVALRKSRSLSWATASAYVFPRHLYADKTARITHWHFAMYLLVWAPLFTMATFAPPLFANVVNMFLGSTFGKHETLIHAEWAVILIQTGVIVLSMSFASYLHHSAFHRIPLLWSFHRSHHSVEALTLPGSVREHPLDLFTIHLFMNAFAGLFGGLTLYLTGTQLHSVTFLIVGLGAAAYFAFSGIFNHTHIPISFGWFNRIVQAPIIHQVHHSAERRHRDKNIGSFWGLMIWDWMFGTLYLPTKDEQYRWGLNEEELGDANPHQRLRDFYFEPFRHAWKLVGDKGFGSFRPSLQPSLSE